MIVIVKKMEIIQMSPFQAQVQKIKKIHPKENSLYFEKLNSLTLILKNFLYFLLFSKWNFLTQALPPKTKKFSQGKSFFLHFLKRRLFLYFLKRKHFLYFQKWKPKFFSRSLKNTRNPPRENFLYFRKRRPRKTFLRFLKIPLLLYLGKQEPGKKNFISENETFREQEMKKPTIKMFNIL